MSRRYQMRRRAERQEETRQRIIEATVALHEEKGAIRTTVSDIADRAGVERATVYRHFPNDQALFTACTGHYYAQFPPPDPEKWVEESDPEARLRNALTEIYAYHRLTETMAYRNLHDVANMPVAQKVLMPLFQHWERVREVLAADWDTDDAEQTLIGALVGHAIDFWTWHSLVRQNGLGEEQAVEAMLRLVTAQRAELVGGPGGSLR